MSLKKSSVKKTLFSSLSTNVWLQQQTQGSFQFQVYIPFKKDIKGLIFWHHRLNCNWKPLGKKIPLDVVIIPSNSQILLNTFNRVIFPLHYLWYIYCRFRRTQTLLFPLCTP